MLLSALAVDALHQFLEFVHLLVGKCRFILYVIVILKE